MFCEKEFLDEIIRIEDFKQIQSEHKPTDEELEKEYPYVLIGGGHNEYLIGRDKNGGLWEFFDSYSERTRIGALVDVVYDYAVCHEWICVEGFATLGGVIHTVSSVPTWGKFFEDLSHSDAIQLSLYEED